MDRMHDRLDARWTVVTVTNDRAHGTYAEGVAFHSPGFAATPRTPGNVVRGDMVTPTGLDNRPTFMAVFVLHARLVRGIPRL